MFTGHVATWNTLEPKDPVKSCAYEFPEVFFVSHTFFVGFFCGNWDDMSRHVKTMDFLLVEDFSIRIIHKRSVT
jgi:hypothetical protein